MNVALWFQPNICPVISGSWSMVPSSTSDCWHGMEKDVRELTEDLCI